MTSNTKDTLITITITLAIVSLFQFIYFTSRPVPDDARIVRESKIRSDAWEAGAMSVVNYDRRAESLPEFKTWDEFEDYAKDSKARLAGLQTFFDEMDADRSRRQMARQSHPKLTSVQ